MSKELLIISINGDQTTSHVIDWIDYLGGCAKRLNTEDLLDSDLTFSSKGDLVLDKTNLNRIDKVWYRRAMTKPSEFTEQIEDANTRQQVVNHSYREKNAIMKTLFSSLSKAEWLSSPSNSNLNKFEVLNTAMTVGLNIPSSLITNNKDELQLFFNQHKEVIVKNVGDSESFSVNGQNYITYTSLIDQEFISKIPERFFPCLFQKKINKSFEIRVFHLMGQNYGMAIFSQNDQQTSVDFRKYNSKIPNRTVPFKIPDELNSQITKLMKDLKLETGSLDFIMGNDEKYYFLEVNPVGQFGMVSKPCNYFLEKEVAKHLMT